jgi:hypothetical protein
LRAQEQAAEIEMMGGDTLGELAKQKDTLRNAKKNIKTVHDQNRVGGKYLSYMWRRVQTNKIIMYCIICVLVFGIGMLLYYWWGGAEFAAAAQSGCTIGDGDYSTGDKSSEEGKDTRCSAGAYCDSNERECVDCAAGKYNDKKGAGTEDACVACSEGKNSQSGWATCCGPNTYNDDRGSVCHQCAEGKHATAGASQCSRTQESLLKFLSPPKKLFK